MWVKSLVLQQRRCTDRQHQGRCSLSASWDALFHSASHVRLFPLFPSSLRAILLQPAALIKAVDIVGIWSHALPPAPLLLSCTFPVTSSIFTPAILGFAQSPCAVLPQWMNHPSAQTAERKIQPCIWLQFGACKALKIHSSPLLPLTQIAGTISFFKERMQSLWTTASLVLWCGHSTLRAESTSVHIQRYTGGNERGRTRGGGGGGGGAGFFIMMLNLTRRLHRSSVPTP